MTSVSKRFGSVFMAGMLGLWALIVLIPMLIVLLGSVKSIEDLKLGPLRWPVSYHWTHFKMAFIKADMMHAFENSLLITGLCVIFIVFLASMAAYPLARNKTRWAGLLYLYFLCGIMVPFQLAMVPLYKLLDVLHLKGTHLGVVLIYTASAMALAIFLYASFFKSVPKELEESALMDGCGPFRMFWKILFPLIKPITSTVVITNALFIWNDFFVPLLFLQSKGGRTIPLSIYKFKGQYLTDWPLTFACVILGSLPLIALFLSLQKHFVKGIASGAVKG